MKKLKQILSQTLRDKETGCLLWQNGNSAFGYGTLRFDGKTRFVHRVVFALANPKADLKKYQVNHHCDNPRCVNPKHLYAGTQSQNVRDAVRRGRHKRAAVHGSQSPFAKLVERQIPAIKRRLRAGESTVKIAKDYNVHAATIWAIGKRNAWNHVK